MKTIKKHLSILQWQARSTIFRLLLLWIAVILAQSALFYQKVNTLFEGQLPLHTEVFVDSFISKVAMLGLLGTALVLIYHSVRKNQSQYTLMRLSLPEKTLFVHQIVFATAIILVYWAILTATALLFCTYYFAFITPYEVNHQNLFYVTYIAPYLHNLMPLSNILCWIRNLVGAVALACTVASAQSNLRRDKQFSKSYLVMLALIYALFGVSMGDVGTRWVSMVSVTFLAISAVLRQWDKWGKTELPYFEEATI